MAKLKDIPFGSEMPSFDSEGYMTIPEGGGLKDHNGNAILFINQQNSLPEFTGQACYAAGAYSACYAEIASNASNASSASEASAACYADCAGSASVADSACYAHCASSACEACCACAASYAESAYYASEACCASVACCACSASYASCANFVTTPEGEETLMASYYSDGGYYVLVPYC